ncbi:MAG: NAD-binding protein [Candidatus Altiarchaeales archaeon]|nr:NAD-binding protein [Candidatus Altiarchaeales archaeon]
MMRGYEHIIIAVFVLVLVIAAGTYGFMLLEGDLSFLDALYFTVMTVSSVGFGDIVPETNESKIFTIFLVSFGVLALFYTVSVVISSLVEIRLLDILRFGRVNRRIRRMKNHVILCGYGEVGSLIAERLGGGEVTVIEKDEEKFNELVNREFAAIHGDSTNPEVLAQAGIKTARGVIIALNSDPDAVYTILTAKELNRDVRIYVRANEKKSTSKMKRAGADYVICLSAVGSREILKALEAKHLGGDSSCD